MAWEDLFNAGVTGGAKLWQSQQNVNAADDQAGRARASDMERRLGLIRQGDQLNALAAESAEGYKPQYATAKTAFATSNIDPTTGQAGYTLDPRTQGLFDKYMQGATKSLDQAGGFDPKAMAAERYGALQDILNPQRAKEDNARMRMLQAKGLTGIGTHEGASGTAMNPYEAAAMAAREQQNKKAAYESLDRGESYLDNLIKRSQGMFSGAKDVESTGGKALDTGRQFSELFTRGKQGQTQAVNALKREAIDAQRKATYDPTAEAVKLLAEKQADATSVKRSGELVDAGTGMFSKLGGIGGIGKAIGSLFNKGESYSPSWSTNYNPPSASFGPTYDTGSAYTSMDLFPSGVEW